MGSGLRLIIFICTLVAASLILTVPATSFGGDGNLTYSEPIREICDNNKDDDGDGQVDESPPCPVPNEPVCFDDEDDNNHDGVDTSDLGCVKPIQPQVTPRVLDIVEGNIWDIDMSQTMGGPKSEGIMFDGTIYRGSTTKTYSVSDSTSSSSIIENYLKQARSEGDNWAFGERTSKSYTQSDFPSGGAIGDTHFKNNRAIYPPSPEGNPACGDALENQDSNQPSPPKGDSAGDDSTTFCTPDYGEIYEKYHVKSPYGTDPPGSASCGCSDSGFTNGPVYYASGDKVVEETEDCDPGVDCSCSGNPPSCDTEYTEDTDYSRHDCNQHNTVSAFYDSGPDTRNDAARTYTEFTAYDSSSEDEAWCGFEFTTTVDADGPRGEGDGFVAIEDRNGGRIAGTIAHDGANKVGNRVWVDRTFKDARSKIDVSCPGDKKACIKYVDFYTKDSGWSTGSGGSGYKSAVKVEEKTYTADESYSACKMINRVASNDGIEERIVNCDYYEDGEPVSPLRGACGDDPRERLVAAEGPQVDEDLMQDFLAFQQQCVQYEDPSGPSDADSGRYTPKPEANNPSDDGIGRVRFADVDKSSGIDSGDGYQDFTGTGTRIRRGNTYPLRVNIALSGGSWFQYTRAWIDWDQNGNLESDESYDVGQCASDGCLLQTSIDVPRDAQLGTTMMRVFEKNDEYPGPNEDVEYGEAEDYSVKIVDPSKELTENACVMDGKIYPEGSVVDVQDDRSKFSGFEVPGDSSDPEVCVGIGGNNFDPYDDVLADDQGSGGSLNVQGPANGDDNGGEWWDMDNRRVTEYLRNNVVDSQEYKDYYQTNLDKDADPSTGLKNYHLSQDGLALEDDCASTTNKVNIINGYQGRSYNCEDEDEDIGREAPFYAEFREGSKDDDFPERGGLETELDMVHNRVQSGGKTGHGNDLTTRSTKVVDTESEWKQGTQFLDVETDGGFLSSTEDRSNKDLSATLAGEDVYGVYTSKSYSRLPETAWDNITLDYAFSGGKHPVVAQYSTDSSFSSVAESQSYMIEASKNSMSFDLTPSTSYEYMRFKIGIAQAPTDPQVIFTVDETYSMNGAHNEVSNEIYDFYNGLGSQAEGSVIGSGCGKNGGRGDCSTTVSDGEPRDTVPGNGLTSNLNDLQTGADNLEERTYFEGPASTVAEAINYPEKVCTKDSNGPTSTNCDGGYTLENTDDSDDDQYGWDATKSRAVVWVQSGGTGYGSCLEFKDGQVKGHDSITEYMESRNFRFFPITRDTGSCDSTFSTAASVTGGEKFTMASSNNAIDFQPILDEIENNLNTIPTVTSVDRVEIGSKSPPPPGGGNTQDDEPAGLYSSLSFDNNAEIQKKDDEWALTPSLEWVIANNGAAYPPEQCHGAPREQGVDKHKRQAVYANSYARAQNDVFDRGLSAGEIDGNWINPDDDTRSVTNGQVTCDLTGHDWGYAVQTDSINGINSHMGSEFDRTGDPTSSGTENVDDIIPVALTVEEQEFAWDMDSNPGSFNQDDLKQWKDACGDDRNEYLIREHAAKINGEYNPEFSGREEYYACADRTTDCVLDGEVYSEGQIVDVSDVTEETNIQSEDQDICLDRNDELPGGEWWDVDNQNIRDEIIGSGDVSASESFIVNGNNIDGTEEFVREGEIDVSKPGKIYWHDSNMAQTVRKNAITEAKNSPYSPLGPTNFYGKNIDYWRGYALEDDCDSDLSGSSAGCDDKGVSITRGTDDDPTSDLIYSHFRESKDNTAVKADDFSTEDSWVVRMYVSGSTAHGSGTNQMNENTPGVNFDSTNWGPASLGGWPTTGLNDSKIDSSEDTWAVSSETYDAVGPTGSVYDTGQCHGRTPPDHSEGWILKNETVMANSFAKREDMNSDGRDEGNWVDPDTTERTVSRGVLTCDLNSTDWGIGYNLGSGSSLNVYEGEARDYGYNTTDRHAVSGPIAFDDGQKPLGENQDDLKQYPNACGDDQNELLIREQYSSYHGDEIYPNLTDRNNTYVCADRITDCAYNSAVYSEGQTLDISSQTSHNQEMGEQLPDEEICLDLNKSTPGGEWYDKDQEFTPEHRIKGLKETYNVSNPSFTASTQIDISGVVEGESDGIVNITDTDTSVNSNGSFFMSNVAADPGKMQLLRYYNSAGQLEAQIRLRFPSDGSDVERVHLSPELMYDGSEVWSGMEKFSDHDFDRNKYHSRYNSTDWRNQDTRYDRTDLAYFNRTGGYYSPPSHRTNVRGQQKRYYSPEGYATEDDCGPLLSKSSTGPCADVGDDTQHQSWFSSGNFVGTTP